MVPFVCFILYNYKEICIFLILDNKIWITFPIAFFRCVTE